MSGTGERYTDIEDVLAHTRQGDYDGHSRFGSLTPEERLEWLDEIAGFVLEFKGLAGRGEAPETS